MEDRLAKIEGLSPTEQNYLLEVGKEIMRARVKFPEPENLTNALAEEFGETVKAYMDEPWANVVSESVQCAAMCLRLALEGDDRIKDIRNRKGMFDMPPLHSPVVTTNNEVPHYVVQD